MNRQPQLHALADVGLDKHVRLGPSKGFDASKASDDVRLMSIGHWQPDGAYGCDLRCPLNVDFVEEPLSWAAALGICGAVSEADSCLFASCGEDRRREGDELRQFPQILGGGG